MKAFIQVNVEAKASFSFKRPLLQWLKTQAPDLAALDLDSFSDEMLVAQACRLMQEAATYAVYFKVEEPNANLGTAFTLLEEIIQEDKPGLILLEGTHARVTAIVKARPHLMLSLVQNHEEAKAMLINYFKLTNSSA